MLQMRGAFCEGYEASHQRRRLHIRDGGRVRRGGVFPLPGAGERRGDAMYGGVRFCLHCLPLVPFPCPPASVDRCTDSAWQTATSAWPIATSGSAGRPQQVPDQTQQTLANRNKVKCTQRMSSHRHEAPLPSVPLPVPRRAAQ
eukprot:361711-Chlamydomonas_euryale.AAC.1